jgi:uncharacterized membrane protein
MNKFIKELTLLVLILLPIVYLATIWQKLPEILPTHFNNSGGANGWSHKSMLIYLVVGLGFGIYLLMLAIPYIDPKKKIKQIDEKYYNFRFIITFFLAILSTNLVYISKVGSLNNPNLILVVLGSFFAILGKFMKTMQPSYFIGFRTPWTLESDHTWKKTHQLAGPIWMVGGTMIALLSIFFAHKTVIPYISFGIIAIMCLVPFVYSYIVYRNEEREEL